MPGNDRFNDEAANYDSNPTRHKSNSLALETLLSHIPQL
jgi:hypothetical protein